MGRAIMKLFVVTKSSELMLNEIVRTPPSERIVIANPNLAEPFLQIGVQIIPLVGRGTNTAERDAAFYEIAMPGVLGDTVIESTNLPAWKVLGIDRLRFWYTPHNDITKIIDMIKFDELIVSFDLHSPVIWQATEHVGKATAIKVSSILDRQHLDFLKWYTKIKTLVVSFDAEKQFLLSQKVKPRVVSAGLEVPGRPRKTDLREKTVGMYYESRFDWKALVMMMSSDFGGKKLIIGFPNNTEWRKFSTTFPNIVNHKNVELQDFAGLLVCEEVLLPHYDESLIRQFPENIKISFCDIANIEKASTFSNVL
jgi:hypothetical protein